MSFPLRRIRLVALLGALVLPVVALAQAAMVIGIHRMVSGPRCQTGYLSVNGRVLCYTLEKSAGDNARDVSSIPAGIYGAILRYDHKDAWRIELTGVEPRTNVQIHIGNFPAETKGCILVGMQVDPTTCALRESAKAYQKLKTAFYGSEEPASSPRVTLRVKIEDVGPADPKPAPPAAKTKG